jgi:collagenase-like PrtC family protease
LPKDQCDLICIDYPDGIQVKSQEEETLFTLNGIQTLSGLRYDLYSELEDMQAMGVDIARISPRSSGTMEILDAYQQKMNGYDEPGYSSGANCIGYWYNEPGMLQNSKCQKTSRIS